MRRCLSPTRLFGRIRWKPVQGIHQLGRVTKSDTLIQLLDVLQRYSLSHLVNRNTNNAAEVVGIMSATNFGNSVHYTYALTHRVVPCTCHYLTITLVSIQKLGYCEG
jgi:hypothetical protein